MSGTPLAKAPCRNCRESHQRCDKRRPVCRRCEIKGLDCQPAQRKAIFRHGSSANFDANFTPAQPWVNSKPKNWRPAVRQSSSSSNPPPDTPDIQDCHQKDAPMNEAPSPVGVASGQQERDTGNLVFENITNFTNISSQSVTSPAATARFCRNQGHEEQIQHSPLGNISSPHSVSRSNYNAQQSVSPNETQERDIRSISDFGPSPSSSKGLTVTPLGGVQESCLLRYFIDELSPWFDHCDDRRHFQLEVPRRAQHCETLRNAVFAVSSRHLCRIPKYKTSRGVVYCGQLLPYLTKSSALEYMLRCIPDLIHFPQIVDPILQENLMAATVILRQYEEMDEDSEDGDINAQYNTDGRVNFLAITHTIIDSMIASPRDQSLATAAYWITVRQEIYHALTRETVPHLRFDSDLWDITSVANNMILFAGQVAKWRWGQQSPDEWAQLKLIEQQLTHGSIGELEPILELKADRKKGKVFPTIWYSFDIQVTAIQHFRLAQMILIAENPHLEVANRAAHRKAEAQVRSIVLELCGIALEHPKVQPGLVNAVIATTLYGEYFTDPEERDALVGVISRTEDIHAWSMKKPFQTLQRRWEMMDNADI